MWDQRFSEPGFAYGSEPNDFLVQHAGRLRPASRVLCLAEGEGRNAVYLAGLGHRVTAVDISSVGLAKARALAETLGLSLETVHADLAEQDLGSGWDAIVAIWAHLPPPVRVAVHRRVVQALAPGGLYLLEAYSPEQLQWKTGGPPLVEMLYDLALLRQDLDGLIFEHAWSGTREIHEGKYHQGMSATVQVVARKPAT